MFLHADLGFALRFPAGWATQNGQAAVLAAPKARDALMRLELQGKGTDPRTAANQFAQANQIRFEAEREERIGGYPAYSALAQAQTDQGQLGLDMTWIAHPAGIFRITGMSPVERFNAYEPEFRAVARSFHDMSAAERASVTELRLQVVTARQDESLEALSRRSGNRLARGAHGHRQ